MSNERFLQGVLGKVCEAGKVISMESNKYGMETQKIQHRYKQEKSRIHTADRIISLKDCEREVIL